MDGLGEGSFGGAGPPVAAGEGGKEGGREGSLLLGLSLGKLIVTAFVPYFPPSLFLSTIAGAAGRGRGGGEELQSGRAAIAVHGPCAAAAFAGVATRRGHERWYGTEKQGGATFAGTNGGRCRGWAETRTRIDNNNNNIDNNNNNNQSENSEERGWQIY